MFLATFYNGNKNTNKEKIKNSNNTKNNINACFRRKVKYILE